MLRPRDPFSIVLAIFVFAVVYYFTLGPIGATQQESLEGVLHTTPPPAVPLHPHPIAKKKKPSPPESDRQQVLPPSQDKEKEVRPGSDEDSGPRHGLEERAKLKHLLLPATQFNADLCKAVATSMMLDFPGPTVVGLKEKRLVAENDTSEMAKKIAQVAPVYKTKVVLEYLEELPEEAQDDLAISMDAYDAWLMLRPEVVEARYYSVLADADERLAQRGILNKENNGTAIKSRIVFGADQSCYPAMSQERRSCAAPPMSPLYDNMSLALPIEGMPENARWLNAGVFMGPVRDLKRLLQATIKLMEVGYDNDYMHKWDDQGSFGDFLGQQEFERGEIAGDSTAAALSSTAGHDVGDWIKENVGTEHGITLDYDSRLIQNAHGSLNYLSWRAYGKAEKGLEPIRASRPPFTEFGRTKSWQDTPTGINSGTHSVFPIFHMTVHKQLRAEVWPKHWIHMFGKVKDDLRDVKPKVIKWSPRADLTEALDWEGSCRAWESALFPEL